MDHWEEIFYKIRDFIHYCHGKYWTPECSVPKTEIENELDIILSEDNLMKISKYPIWEGRDLESHIGVLV